MSLAARRRLHGRIEHRLGTVGDVDRKVAPPPAGVGVRQARPVVLPPLTGATKVRIAVRLGGVVVWLVIDDSGSMYSTWGDPTGIRYAAARSVVSLMRRSGGGRVGVVHWGSAAPPELVAGPVGVLRGRRVLASALTLPEQTLGGNDLPAALHRTAEQIETTTPTGLTPLVLVVTDGIEAVTAQTHAAVAALPADSVHMVLVDRSSQCDERMEAAWREVAFGSFTRLDTFDVRGMALQLAALLADATGLTAPAA